MPREDGDGCLSMLVGEALRLLVLEQALDLADFDPARGLYGDDTDGEDGGMVPF